MKRPGIHAAVHCADENENLAADGSHYGPYRDRSRRDCDLTNALIYRARQLSADRQSDDKRSDGCGRDPVRERESGSERLRVQLIESKIDIQRAVPELPHLCGVFTQTRGHRLYSAACGVNACVLPFLSTPNRADGRRARLNGFMRAAVCTMRSYGKETR